MREFLLERKKITLSIPEFLSYERGEKTLSQIVDERKIEKLLSDPKIFKVSTITLALVMTISEKAMAVDVLVKLSKLEEAAALVINLIQQVGFLICTIMALIELIRAMVKKDLNEISSIFVKYILGFASLYALPWAFEIIRGMFV